MNGTLRVARVGGIPISIHASWLAIYALITWTLAVGYFPEALPNLPAIAYWVNGLVASLLLFVSVLLHELSHSFVARAHGLSVRGITLHVFGGVSQLDDEAPSPRAEFLIAVVGPLTSFAIAAVLWAVGWAGVVARGSVAAIMDYLVFFNVAVGVFNLIPGFPLDGGRLLRAGLWKWTGSLRRATAIASRVGAGFAIALMAVGVVQILNGAFLGGLWMILIGTFLRGAADSSYTQLAMREALATLPVREVMARKVVTVPVTATVDQLVERFWAHHVTSFPVVDANALDAGPVRGIVSVRQVSQVPRERWGVARVEEVMRPLSEELTIAPGDTVLSALEKTSRNGLGRLAVLEDGRLVGYLSTKDITHVLALREFGADAKPATAPGRLRRAA